MRTDSSIFRKTEDAVLDFSINWAAFTASGTITSSEWTVESGVSVLNTSISGIYTTVWISGGIAGSAYCFTNVVSISGLQDSVTGSIYIE